MRRDYRIESYVHGITYGHVASCVSFHPRVLAARKSGGLLNLLNPPTPPAHQQWWWWK